MIPSLTVNSFIIALALTTVVPIAVTAVLGVKRKINMVPFLIGAAAFFVSQMIIRIPLLNVLSGIEWFQSFAIKIIPYVIMLSFTAGLFEESARLAGAHILKKNRSYKDAISFGLGHGLCEVLFIVGIAHFNNIVFCFAINNPGGVFATYLPPEALETVKALLTDVNIIHIYIGVLERVFAVTFHIFASVLVFRGVVLKKWWYLVLAILAHTVFNLAAILLATYVNIYASEAALLVMAAAAGWYVIRSRKEWRVESEEFEISTCYDGE